MPWAPWVVALLSLTAVGYLVAAGVMWGSQRSVAGRPLVVLLLALFAWTACYALELASRSVPMAQFWSAAKFVGIALMPPALWAFVMEYTGRGRLSRRSMLLLSIEPAIVLLSYLLPGTQHWMHLYPAALGRPGDQQFVLGAPYPEAGWLFWPHAGYTYLLMLGAVSLLALQLARIAPVYRKQGAVLLLASLLPFVGNLVWNLDSHGPAVDPSPFLFAVTALVMVWGVFRLGLLDVAPVARGVVLEHMRDAVLVLDVYDRVVDVNPAAAALLGRSQAGLIGRSIDTVAQAVAPVLDVARARGTEGQVQMLDPLAPTTVREMSVLVSPVNDQLARTIAWLVQLRDVTERNRMDEQVRRLLAEQIALTDVLRDSLMPTALPQRPGLRLAARSVQHRDGVSGDFYDVHPWGSGAQADTAFVLGDVSGKGVRAAVLTALTRYTVRTLSAQSTPPEQVLMQLNRALLERQPRDAEQYCTVVYGRVGPDPRGTAGELRLELALGGHPAPLLRRADGTVETVGRPGTALGLLPSIECAEVSVQLHRGDLLLAYTDGVTEARCAGEQFGEERLATVLAEAGGAAPAPAGPRPPVPPQVPLPAGPTLVGAAEPATAQQQRAEQVADSVLQAVRDFSPEQDDIALLVLLAT